MTPPDKLLVSPELEEAFRAFVTARRAVDLAVQAVMDAAMNSATKQQEKLNKVIEDWWSKAGVHYGIDFTAASYHVEVNDGKMWIVLLGDKTGETEQPYRSRLDS